MDPEPLSSSESVKAVGEIVETHTARLIAQCLPARLQDPPYFGSFVRVLPTSTDIRPVEAPVVAVDPFADPASVPETMLPADTPDGTLYALVYASSTGSADLGRRPTAYGLSEEELRREQPQIFDLIATHFEALHLGYAEGRHLRSRLPPRPPRLHAAVYECTCAEVCALTASPDLLRRVLASTGAYEADQLLAACLRHAYDCRNQDFGFLVRVGKQLAGMLRDDPERLVALLRSLEPA